MRPSVLDPWFAPVASLPGVGPKLGGLFARLLGRDDPRVIDLLTHLPTGAVDRRASPALADAQPGETVTVAVTIDRHRAPPRGSRAPHRIYAHDGTGDLVIVYFRAPPGFLERTYPVGEVRYVSGRLEFYDGHLQMTHPERVLDETAFSRAPTIEPVYPGTEGLAPGAVRRSIATALDKVQDLPEWQESPWRPADWPTFRDSLARLHRPEAIDAIEPLAPAHARLAYDELLASQIALQIMRARMRRVAGRRSTGDGRFTSRIESALPFSLTTSQRQAVEAIAADLAAPDRMLRLLQGDVGAGKTVVALLAMAIVVEAGRQAALMAPTEILARQHLKSITPLAEAAGLRVALLTGREKGRTRDATLAAIASGDVDIVVGTHALFQDEVIFRDLALAVVDEQHRFGVHQRLALARKGDAVDLLVMTATPIPRTLVLTAFGDMDVSSLREKPAGRRPIDTRTISLDRLDEVVEAVGRAIEAGGRCYWVCPLVAESETSDLAAAEDRHEALRQRFGDQVALVHGRMKAAEKDDAMARFARGEARVLVATTVVEVGVDVPEATVMVIEHAERFGLAQLHQLRGRVGRGAAKSTCLLLYKDPLGEVARARLAIMRETEDGFRIAEEDLRLRGEGDVLGTRQSGTPGFRIARLDVHGDLLRAAREDAQHVFAEDPELTGKRGAALRVLLYLFERDAAIRLLRAG